MKSFIKFVGTLAVSGLCCLTAAILVLCLWYSPLKNHTLSIKCLVDNCNNTIDTCYEDINNELTDYPCNKICIKYTLPKKNITKIECITVDNDDLNDWCENRLVINCYMDNRNFTTLSLTDNWKDDKENSYSVMLMLFLLSGIAIGVPISLISIECFIKKQVSDEVRMSRLY